MIDITMFIITKKTNIKMAYCSSIKALCILVFVLASTVSSQNPVCPFDLLFHLGDGVFDNGNAMGSQPYGLQLPAASLPYGQTDPGTPNGRWCDGLLDIDYGAQGLGFEKITAYLTGNATTANAIMFAAARSPVLDRQFFTSRGIKIPPYVAPLSVQMSWFKKYLTTICVTPEDCADKLANSLFLFGDVEANDIAFSLIHGKSIDEVQSYVAHITAAQINAAIEVIRLGGTRVILPGNAPIGCYPYILTELATNDTSAYDDVGCLKTVNDFIVSKNDDLQQAIADLREAYPDILIFYADFYNSMTSVIRKTFYNSPNGNLTLQTCCGTGGKYNYDRNNFCGAPGVPICADPNKYLFWDGIHLTQEANRVLSISLGAGARPTLGCSVPDSYKLWNSIKTVPSKHIKRVSSSHLRNSI